MIILQTDPHPVSSTLFYRGSSRTPIYHLKFSVFAAGANSTFEFEVTKEMFESLGDLQDKKFRLVMSTVEESIYKGE